PKKTRKKRKSQAPAGLYGGLLAGAGGIGVLAGVGVLLWLYRPGQEQPAPPTGPPAAAAAAAPAGPPVEAAAAEPPPPRPPDPPGGPSKLLAGAWELQSVGGEQDPSPEPGRLDF